MLLGNEVSICHTVKIIKTKHPKNLNMNPKNKMKEKGDKSRDKNFLSVYYCCVVFLRFCLYCRHLCSYCFCHDETSSLFPCINQCLKSSLLFYDVLPFLFSFSWFFLSFLTCFFVTPFLLCFPLHFFTIIFFCCIIVYLQMFFGEFSCFWSPKGLKIYWRVLFRFSGLVYSFQCSLLNHQTLM